MSDSDPPLEQLLTLIRADPSLHFTACSHIKMKDGKVRRPDMPNTLQIRLFTAYLWLQTQGLPINLIVLKPRQSGGSEGTAELCYHHSRRFNLGGFMMADQHDRTDKIWNLFCNKAGVGMDRFEPFWGNTFKHNTEQAKIRFKDEGGRMCEAVWDRGTANDTGAGTAGTRQIIWLSESARYAKDGKFRDTEVIGNALNSIPPDAPNTMRIAESTAEGASGWHHETFENAVALEDRMLGKVGNGWVKIFVGWHECDDYALPDLPQNREYFDDSDGRWSEYADDEEAGRIRYGWTPEQIAWRRKKIISDLGGDVKMFLRDFPTSPEEAWASSGSKRFNVVAVARMLKVAEHAWSRTMADDPNAPKLGGLIDSPGGPVWQWLREDAWLWVSEAPEYGRSYTLVVDPMTGEQSAGSDKRDNHACMIVRAEYFDEKGIHHLAEVAAVIHQPNGCQWDMDVLADRLALLSRWYGRCIVIPEVNKAMDLIPLLKDRGVQLYHRPARPDAENPSTRQKVVGFYTSESTRRMWVTAAAEAIREGTLGCLYLPAVKEFDTFIIDKSGKPQGAPGTHDDWVAAYGIAKLTIGAATRMALPIVRMTPPRGPVRSYGGRGSAAIG